MLESSAARKNFWSKFFYWQYIITTSSCAQIKRTDLCICLRCSFLNSPDRTFLRFVAQQPAVLVVCCPGREAPLMFRLWKSSKCSFATEILLSRSYLSRALSRNILDFGRESRNINRLLDLAIVNFQALKLFAFRIQYFIILNLFYIKFTKSLQ